MSSSRNLGATLAALALAFGTAGAVAAQTFEGTAEYRDITVYGDAVLEMLEWPDEVDPEQAFGLSIDRLLEAAGTYGDRAEVEEMTMTIKGSKYRIGTEDGYVIMDGESGVMRLVQPSQKAYIEFTTEDMESMQERAEEAREEAQAAEESGSSEAVVRELGSGGDVNGVPTTLYELRAGDEVTRAWVTDRYGSLRDAFRAFVEWSEQMGGEEEDEVDPMVPLLDEGLPVRTLTFDTYSNELQVGDLLSVMEGPVSDDAFTIPSDYQKQSFPGMPGGE